MKIAKKYYFEIYNNKSGEYIIQSKWCDDEDTAVKLCKMFDYIGCNYKIRLMSATFMNDDILGDINYERELYNW